MEHMMDVRAEDLSEDARELGEDELEAIAGGLLDVTVPVVVQLNLAVLSAGVTQGNLVGLGIGRYLRWFCDSCSSFLDLSRAAHAGPWLRLALCYLSVITVRRDTAA